jgi:hypothetical protein
MERYTANIIAENLFSQCEDSEGRSFRVLKEIVDHSKDHSAVPMAEGFTVGAIQWEQGSKEDDVWMETPMSMEG